MCLIVVAHGVSIHPKYKTIVALNRDEFYHRPTKHLHLWKDVPILAGRDEERGGTWFGIDQRDPERWAAVTNYRGKSRQSPSTLKTIRDDDDNDSQRENTTEVENPNLPSRGDIVVNYLSSKHKETNTITTAVEYLEHLKFQKYNGFNVLLGDSTGVYYYGNRVNDATGCCFKKPLPPGIYGLCNDVLDTNWPKLKRCKEKLLHLLLSSPFNDSKKLTHHYSILPIMMDTKRPKYQDLPSTGVPLEFEKLLSAIYIDGNKDYGTRSTTSLLINHDRDRKSVV